MSLLGIANKFKHKAEIRESQDEILVGEVVYLLSLQGWPCLGFAGRDVRFRTLNDAVLHSLQVKLRQAAAAGPAAGAPRTLALKAEVKNTLADPGDLLRQWSVEVPRRARAGQVRLSHELGSVFAEKETPLDLEHYVLQGERGRRALNALLVGATHELREALKPYRM
jgi:hypothetical protein